MRPLNHYISFLITLVVLIFSVAGCTQEEDVLDDLRDTSFQLVDQDSAQVVFPHDLEGQVVLVGYIYTNCPDFCPAITGNMMRVRNQLEAPDDVHFVTVTFDPERDTPSVMRSYRDVYGITGSTWQFLTGEKDQVDAFMERLGLRHRIADGVEERGDDRYLIDHNDRMTLIDQQGRVVMHYVGSRTPAEYLVEDINALREST